MHSPHYSPKKCCCRFPQLYNLQLIPPYPDSSWRPDTGLHHKTGEDAKSWPSGFYSQANFRSFCNSGLPSPQGGYIPIWKPKWVSSIWLMQSDIAKVQSDMYIRFNANQPGINAMWPSVYMHSGNLELCNATSVINAFQHHVKCHFDITTEYLLE